MFGKVSEDSFRDIFDSSLFLSPSDRVVKDEETNNSDAGDSIFSSDSGLFGLSNNNNKRRQPFQQLQHGCIGDNRKQQQQLFPDNSLALDLQNLNNKINNNNDKAVSSQQQQQQQKVNPNRYKTELCRPFQENGVCKYGEKCQFAHGNTELRTVSRHPKYKTDLCRTYHSVGFCPYGPRCHFIHNLEEVKSQQTQQQVSSPSSSLFSSKASSSSSNATSPSMPPLPMFSPGSPTSSSLTHEQVSRLGGGERLRNPSESGYTSSSCSSSSSSDSDAFSPLAQSRLPVFSTLSK